MSVTCRTILSDIQTVPGSVSSSTYFFLSVLTVAPPQEQKLALQSRTKDGHLSQLGEVEKRFSALSRQCAMVKRAHDNLEQNGNRYRKTDIYIYIWMLITLCVLMIPWKQLYAQIRSRISHMCRFSLSLLKRPICEMRDLSVIRLFSAEEVLVCSQYSLNSLGYKYNKVLETVHRDPGTS